jgi:hypothetical protein
MTASRTGEEAEGESMRLRFILLFLIMALPSFAAERSVESTRAWREDLEYARTQMPLVHKNLFHTITREQFDASFARLAEKVPEWSDRQLVVGLATIVASVGDGHTHMNLAQPAVAFHMIPLKFQQFRDGIYVRAAAEPHGELAGGKVISIEGRPADEVWNAVAVLTPHDNESGLRFMNAAHVAVPEILHALGIGKSDSEISLRVSKNGKIHDATLQALPIMEAWTKKMVDARPDSVAPPLYVQSPEQNFWYRYLADEKLLYVKFNTVYWARTPDGGYQSPGEFFDEVFAFADSHPVERFVVDVRDNGGGNNSLNLAVIHGFIKRDALNRRGHLFTIIGRATFSAAQNFVNEMEKHTNTLFAGEPTAARPNSYGDPTPLTLPNSKVQIQVSTLFWQDAHPADDRVATMPQIAVEPTFADYAAGRDPVLEAVRHFRLLDETMRDALKEGAAAATHAYREFRDNPLYASLSTEREINLLAQERLKEGGSDDALLLVRLNLGTYPKSASSHQLLGDILLGRGERDAAIGEYETASALEPRNPYRREVLEKARAAKP